MRTIPAKLAVFLLLLQFTEVIAESPHNIALAVASVSKEMHNLHVAILWICAVSAIAVFAVMIYSIITHRKSKNAGLGNFHKSSYTEFIWTVIPFAILVVMAIPSINTLFDPSSTQLIAPDENTIGDDLPALRVNVTGSKCEWRYEYPEHEISFSTKPLAE